MSVNSTLYINALLAGNHTNNHLTYMTLYHWYCTQLLVRVKCDTTGEWNQIKDVYKIAKRGRVNRSCPFLSYSIRHVTPSYRL